MFALYYCDKGARHPYSSPLPGSREDESMIKMNKELERGDDHTSGAGVVLFSQCEEVLDDQFTYQGMESNYLEEDYYTKL